MNILEEAKREDNTPPPARNEGNKLERMLDDLHAIAAQPRNGRTKISLI